VLQGVVPDRQALRATFDRRLGAVLDAATLPRPVPVWQLTGGREGRHSEHLGPLLAEMQVLPRTMPEASW
jgi:ring-1,2-phenylacetyl-CoA epoxidase subunit PaaC